MGGFESIEAVAGTDSGHRLRRCSRPRVSDRPGHGDRNGERLRERVCTVLEPEQAKSDGGLEIGRLRRLAALRTRRDIGRGGGREAPPAARAAQVSHG
jgi:hypothetical protein